MDRLIPIIIDDRECASAVPQELARAGMFELEVRRLAVGDYLVDERLLFERKTLTDLTESIKEGRLFSQALRLAQSPKRVALILEGTMSDLRASAMRWEPVQGALIAVTLFIGIPLLRARSPQETARTIEFAAVQGRTISCGALPRHGRRPKGKAALQRHLLQGLPGVGPLRAARLLERFGTVEAVLTADVQALASVEGIGAHIARRMRWALQEERARYERRASASRR